MKTVILKKSDLTGDLTGFPIEIVKRMLIEQHLQGNPSNVDIFKRYRASNRLNLGFDWRITETGHNFWHNILQNMDFGLFFKYYPEKINGDEVRITFEENPAKETVKTPLNLAEILKDCPVGTKLYSAAHGEGVFKRIEDESVMVTFEINDDNFIKFDWEFTLDGKLEEGSLGECILFPSKTQRDWSKFIPDLPKGTPVMCSNGNDWVACIYEGNTRDWNYIIPVKDFDFQDLNANKLKKNYSK